MKVIVIEQKLIGDKSLANILNSPNLPNHAKPLLFTVLCILLLFNEDFCIL